MVQQTYNQTENKHFVRSLSGSQLMWQIDLYLPGPTGKIRYQNPVPNFSGIAWVLYFDFFFFFFFFFFFGVGGGGALMSYNYTVTAKCGFTKHSALRACL